MSDFTYIGRKECGCVVAMVVDIPDRPEYVGKTVSEFIRDGLTIERVQIEESRHMFTICEHDKQPVQSEMFNAPG